MKQQITQSQFEELTQEQKDKLINWGEGHGYVNEITSKKGSDIVKKRKYVLLNIGQMIEFLKTSDPNNANNLWFDAIITSHYDREIPKDASELCDALWEAIKEII